MKSNTVGQTEGKEVMKNRIGLPLKILFATLSLLYLAGFVWTLTDMYDHQHFKETLLALGGGAVTFGSLALWKTNEAAWQYRLTFVSLFLSLAAVATLAFGDSKPLEIIAVAMATVGALVAIVSPGRYFQLSKKI